MISTPNTVVDRDDGTVTIAARGMMDITNGQQFRQELLAASESADRVTVDLRGADFIDTAILEYLARAAKSLQRRDKRLKVVVAEGSHPMHVLRVVGFSVVMDVETDAPDGHPREAGTP